MNRRSFLKCLPAASAGALLTSGEDEVILKTPDAAILETEAFYDSIYDDYFGYLSTPLPEGRWQMVEWKLKKVKETQK